MILDRGDQLIALLPILKNLKVFFSLLTLDSIIVKYFNHFHFLTNALSPDLVPGCKKCRLLVRIVLSHVAPSEGRRGHQVASRHLAKKKYLKKTFMARLLNEIFKSYDRSFYSLKTN